MRLARQRRYWIQKAKEEGTVPTIKTIKHGALYNWNVGVDPRNVGAEGWRVPSRAEYTTLRNNLGGQSVAGNALKITGTELWAAPNSGTNSAKFNGVSVANRSPDDGSFDTSGYWGYMWATGLQGTLGHVAYLRWANGIFEVNVSASTGLGIAIRLIKTSTDLTHGESGVYTGNDGQVYRTICIHGQEWLADNLIETKYRNGDTIPLVEDSSEWVNLTGGGRCFPENNPANAYSEVPV